MPKQRITKAMIVDAAFDIARNSGMEQVLVKNIADRIGCSVQPIYSYCQNIEGLRGEVVERVRDFVHTYAASHVDKNNLFRSTGQAYIQLAKEEPNLFKIFILHKRKDISSLSDLYQSETNPYIAEALARKLHINSEQAIELHLHMLIYTIGIGTIFAASTPGISTDEIFAQQEKAYEAFLKHALAQKQ